VGRTSPLEQACIAGRRQVQAPLQRGWASAQPIAGLRLAGSVQDPGEAQVTLHVPVQTWPCRVLKEKGNCTCQAD